MALYLRTKKMDIQGGDDVKIMLHELDAERLGVHDGNLVEMRWQDLLLNVNVVVSGSEIEKGYIGLYSEIWERYPIPSNTYCSLSFPEPTQVPDILKKKILGKKLTEDELMTVMREMGNRRIGMIETAYFMGTFFNPGFDEDEVLWMTRGMAASGDVLSFKDIRNNGDIVVDKHSIGGVAGKGITPVIVPIIAAFDLVIPNTSTRAITSPAGTSDILEVVMPVSLDKEEIMDTVKETGGCLIWGGALDLAPADDVLIHVEKVIHLESFQKILVSIVAKKISMGVTHIVMDIPYGRGTKVQNPEDAEMLDREFRKLYEKVGIKCEVYKRVASGPDGRSIGPNLEMKEGLKILERTDDRSKHLENLIVDMCEIIVEMSGKCKKGEGRKRVYEILDSKKALEKFWEIAKKQGATKEMKSEEIIAGEFTFDVISDHHGKIKMINNKGIMKISRALGTPVIKEAGLYMHKMVGDMVKPGDKLMTLFATTGARLEAGKKLVDINEQYEFFA